MNQLFRKQNIALVLIALFILTFFSSFMAFVNPEKPVTKRVEIAIYAGSDYSQEIYRNTKAQVEVSVFRYRANKFEAVYTTTLDTGSLSEVPSVGNALIKAVEINNFREGHEILIAKYKVTYVSKGDVLSYNKYVLLTGKSKSGFVVTI